MNNERLTGSEKAAIFLRAVGDEAASAVLRNLTDEEVQHLGNYMANMGSVEPERVVRVMEEFLGGASGAGGISAGDSELVKKILERAFGREKAENVVSNLSVPTEEAGLETLKFLDAQTIANFLRNEHPQTIALILAHLEPTQAGVVLALLPEGCRGEVAYRMATLERIPPGVISELDIILSNELTASGTVQSSVVGGAKPVAEMLNQMDKANETAILGRINEMNPELAERIKQMMFTFEDLANVDDRGMQAILREVSNDDITLALKSAGEEVRDKILSNMSERAAALIQEDLEAMGPVRLSEVEKAQQAIVLVAKRLEEEGKVIVAGRGGEDMLV